MKEKAPIPVTVLTGFLGAGKTTLLNHLLRQNHGYKCAIVINEFGPIGIDGQLVVGADEEILELNNGCLCCRVRGDLIKSLGDLIRRQKRFDYVLIETTGLADPSPIAHTFKASELAAHLRLDGIVTLVDAPHLEKELGDSPEAAVQIAFADVILLNKTDLVTPEQIEKVEGRIRKMNPLAAIHHTRESRIEPAKILNLKARELDASFSLPAGLAAEPAHEHEHEHGDEHEHAHAHDEAVGSFHLADERPLDLDRAEAWLGHLVQTAGVSIYRSKGILHIKGQPKRIIFQGVQMMIDAKPDRFWNIGEKRGNQIVFIGRDLDQDMIRAGFEGCVAE